MTPPPITPAVTSLTCKNAQSQKNTRDLIKNEATIGPDIGVIRNQRGSFNLIILIRRTPFSTKTRRASTKCNLNLANSTLSSSSSPRRGTINTRQLEKPAMPVQTPGPMGLFFPHQIMKLRFFTNLNKRRKGTFPKQMTITIWLPTKPTRYNLVPNPTKKKTIPNTTNHDAAKQSLISFPHMRRVKELQGAMNIKQRSTTKTLPTAKDQQKLCNAKHQG